MFSFFREALTDPGARPACGKLPPAIMRTPAHVGEGRQLLFGSMFAKNKFGQEKTLNWDGSPSASMAAGQEKLIC